MSIIRKERSSLLRLKRFHICYFSDEALQCKWICSGQLKKNNSRMSMNCLWKLGTLRWLDWIFWGGYLPSLSINYVAKSKDMEKRLPQLYYIKMKMSYDLGFIAIGVAMAT